MPESSDPPKRVYTQEEVNAILSRAIERQQPEGALSLEEIVASAREAGIAPEAVEAAARELEEDSADRAIARRGRDRMTRGWIAHVVTYLSIIGFLLVLNLMTTPVWWVQWPAMGWGLGLLIHTLTLVFADKESRARRDKKRARREERRRAREVAERERRERRERKRAVETGARELGQAVERAAATLLAATAKKIHEEVDRAGGAPPRARVDASRDSGRAREGDRDGEKARRARVEARDDDADEDELQDEREDRPRAKRRG